MFPVFTSTLISTFAVLLSSTASCLNIKFDSGRNMDDTKSPVMDVAAAYYEEHKSLLKPINETIAKGESAIQKFYEGTSVFVTGGTGFLGKQLIEKLLR